MWNPFANMGTLAGNEITTMDELAQAAAAQLSELSAFQTFEFYSNQPAEALCHRIAEVYGDALSSLG